MWHSNQKNHFSITGSTVVPRLSDPTSPDGATSCSAPTTSSLRLRRVVSERHCVCEREGRQGTMLDFMDYIQLAFAEATNWNRDNSYLSLTTTAQGKWPLGLRSIQGRASSLMLICRAQRFWTFPRRNDFVFVRPRYRHRISRQVIHWGRGACSMDRFHTSSVLSPLTILLAKAH